MKRIIVIIPILFMISLFAENDDRQFDNSVIHEMGNMSFRVSNYGFLGSGGYNFPSLEWPTNSGTEYLNSSSLWISAKKRRRNETGQPLYWFEWPPNDRDDCGPDVTSWPVVDTLTSVGYDGDSDLYELLPAYNPLETAQLGMQYAQYMFKDIVLKNAGYLIDVDDDNDGLTDEDNLGSPFNWNDPDEIFCFTIPTDEDGDGLADEDCGHPGFESSISYFYDYSPFNSDGERDWGNHASGNKHGVYEQLHLAVSQEIYFWPVQYYADVAMIKHTIYNTSAVDTLYDVCLGYLVDADVGPQTYSLSERANDDRTSYIIDDNIAYTYDADGDEGYSPGYLGFKIYNPDDHNVQCWYWNLGDGPDDDDPLDLSASPTANQKYWLMEGRNPDPDKYFFIPDDPAFQQNDERNTRFMYALSGDQEGFNNPSNESINLAPENSLEFYSMIIMATSEDGLEDKCLLAEQFIQSGFDYNAFTDLPSLPYIVSANNISYTQDVLVKWLMLSSPDEFGVYFKQVDEPAANWQYIQLDPDLGEYVISDLVLYENYEFKVGCWFEDVYLESKFKYAYISGGLDAENNLVMAQSSLLQNFPNPFNPTTTISFSLTTEITENTELVIYNLKGQKVKSFPVILSPSTELRTGFVEGSTGQHSVVWNGTDDAGNSVSSGIYFAKLKAGKLELKRKMLLLK